MASLDFAGVNELGLVIVVLGVAACIVLIVGFLKRLNVKPKDPGEYICTQCGQRTFHPELIQKGSGQVEFLLWVFLLWPIALFYSIWRRSVSAYYGCAKCRGNSLIPMDSPLGHKQESQNAK
jgi:hypothetical protein